MIESEPRRRGSAPHLKDVALGVRGSVARQSLLVFLALLVIVPAYFLLITSFKTTADYGNNKIGLPVEVFFGNFVTAMRGGRFFLWFLNSVILVVGAVALSTLVAALAAFAFARMTFRGRNPLLAVITSLMVIPPVVMIIPLFLFFSKLKLTSTYPAAILVYAGMVVPFSVFLLTNFFKTIPHEIIESALIDGASVTGILTRIMMPLSAPAIVTLIVVNALWVWNDLLIALVLLPNDHMRSLMVGITVFGSRYSADVPVALAGMLLASIPMLLLFVFGQRYFMHGMVSGALKG